MRARLTVESGTASPHVVELDDDTVARLGRNRDNTILVQDRHASRWHAQLFFRNSSWLLSDQETTNGTRLDGVPIHGETPLADGQVISIGDVRLRFDLVPPTKPAREEPPAVPAGDPKTDETTLFQVDELTELFHFMNSSLSEATPQRLVSLALEIVLRQTGADLAGFLSLDDSPQLRLVLPPPARVDHQLSRQLTRLVQESGRLVWLGAPESNCPDSDSLTNFHDAVCVPLRVSSPANGGPGEAPLGALHVYKNARAFNERQVRFCEVLAGSLASTLHLLRVRRALEADNSRLRGHAPSIGDDLVGDSPAMGQLRQQIGKLARAPCTVLIVGESGVGKELVALALHRQSERRRGPLVTVNCATIPESLAEAELFGHASGSFTGARGDRPGYFAQAEMGTLFLDEIGELPVELQAKLLRAIEYRHFRPVGAVADVRADVRVIAATNRDLEGEVKEGRFRRDLFYRLTTALPVPPLREHLEDVPELVRHFLEHFQGEYRRRVTVTEAAMERLRSYSWPGNVRQLRSVLEGAVALAEDGGTINAGDLRLPDELAVVSETPTSLNLEVLEEWAIRQALAQAGTNVQAARLLGIHRTTLIEKRKKYRLGRGE